MQGSIITKYINKSPEGNRLSLPATVAADRNTFEVGATAKNTGASSFTGGIQVKVYDPDLNLRASPAVDYTGISPGETLRWEYNICRVDKPGPWRIEIRFVERATSSVMATSITIMTATGEEEEPAGDMFTLAIGSLQAQPAKSSYKTGETVTLNIAYDVARNAAVLGTWSINAEVYSESGTLLDRDGETNIFYTNRSISSLSNPKVHPRFTMSSVPMLVTVKLKVAYNPLIGFTKEETLGTVTVTIPLTEEAPGQPGMPPSESFTLLPGSLQVQPDRASYAPGDLVTLKVAYDVSYPSAGPFGSIWSVNAEVYSSDGTLLDRDGETNMGFTARSVSSLADPTIHPRFYMSNNAMQVTVILTADGTELGRAVVTIPLSTGAGVPSTPDGGDGGETPGVTLPTTLEGWLPWILLGIGAAIILSSWGGAPRETTPAKRQS